MRVGVFGVYGRMGGEVCRAVTMAPNLDLVAGLDIGDGRDDAEKADVIVDFTHPDGVMDNIKWCIDHGIDAEVLDLRSIRPLDEQAILESVARTHRVVLVDENKPFCGVGAQIASLIADQAFDELDAPIKRVSSLDAPDGGPNLSAVKSLQHEAFSLPVEDRLHFFG